MALAGTHYTATNGTMVFLPGETSKGFFVPITDNDQLGGNRSFTVQLTSPFDGTLGLATATVTITDDEVSYVGFTLAKRWVDENNGTVPLAVVRTGSTNRQVSVRYATVNGTALAGSDYNATSGTLTFAAGETNKAISLTLRTDAITEAAESMYVRLSSPTGTSLGTHTNLEVVIRNSAAASMPALASELAADPSLGIESLAFAGPDQLRLHIIGPSQVGFVLEASTNLVDWVPIATESMPEGGLDWIEPVDSVVLRRYFRVVSKGSAR
jgi:chitinase